MSAIPENRGPILDSVIKKKLYKCAAEIMIPIEKILRYNLKEIGRQVTLEKERKQIEMDETFSNNGPFNNIPREIIFKIFSYLNLYSLGKIQAKRNVYIQIKPYPQLRREGLPLPIIQEPQLPIKHLKEY